MTSTTEADICGRWLDVEGRVLRYAAQENRKPVKTLLIRYHASDEENASLQLNDICIYVVIIARPLSDRTTGYVLLLLGAMLQARGKGKASLFTTFEVSIHGRILVKKCC